MADKLLCQIFKGGKSMQTLTTIKPGETFAISALIETDDGTLITIERLKVGE